jgi:hypothetical protein
MHYTVKAWVEIDEITIKNCFRKAGIVKEQEDEALVEHITEHNTIDGNKFSPNFYKITWNSTSM